MIAQAVQAGHASHAAGLFVLAWGVGASVLGLLSITNFRDFLDNWARQASNFSLVSFERNRRRAQLISILLVIVGPIAIAAAIILITRGQIDISAGTPLPTPGRYLFIGAAVLGVGLSWLWPNGLYRSATRRGLLRAAVAVLSSAGLLAFAVAFAMGKTVIAIVAWVILGMPVLILGMADKPAWSTPEGSSGRSSPHAGARGDPGLQGWAEDPFRLHEQRYFSAGRPTKLVRDDGVESYDEPPPGGRLAG